MRLKHRMISADELGEVLHCTMQEYDDDLEMTVAPMRRDSAWGSATLYLYREGTELTPDPLYAWFCWVERVLANQRAYGVPVAFDALEFARNRMVAILDAAWAQDRREP